MAKAFLETRGLKSKVAGEWIEHPEEYTMVLVSTQSKDPKSPIVLPGTCFAKDFPVIQAQPAATIYPEDPSSTEEDNCAEIYQTSGDKRSSTEIRTLEDFTRKHDPKIILPPSSSASQQEQQRGRLPIRPSDLRLKVNKNGKAEVRKKKTPKRRADSELRPSYPEKSASGGVRLVVLENGSIGVDKDTKPTLEVESLLQTGIDASKRGNATSLTNRLQDSRTPTVQDVRPQRFSDMERRRLKIDSDHMPATTSQESSGRQSFPPNLKSTPPRPDWSPIENPNPAASLIATPGPSPTQLKPAKKANRSSVNPKSPSPSLRETEIDLQKGLVERPKKSGYPTLPFPGPADALNTNPAKENLNPSTAASNQDDQASSILPVSQDDFTFDYDSGLGTSRGTSTEPELAKRQKPGAKQPQQIGNHIVTQLNKKTGKAARGPYITRKKAAKEIAAAAMSLGEKVNGAT
jgi:hypothetical protein